MSRMWMVRSDGEEREDMFARWHYWSGKREVGFGRNSRYLEWEVSSVGRHGEGERYCRCLVPGDRV